MPTLLLNPTLTERALLPDHTSIVAVRLVIIEDCHSFAEMLQVLCEQNWGLDVVGVEYKGESGLAAVERTKPDLILLDIGLPDVDGLTLLPRLRKASASSKIIILSSLCNDYVLGQLPYARWDAVLDKIADGLTHVQEAIKVVRSGNRYVSPTVRQLLREHQNSNNPFSGMLSEREKEILVCIAHALTNEEIAIRMSIDQCTVQSHRKSLLMKLGLHSTPKLMSYAIEHGYASLRLPP